MTILCYVLRYSVDIPQLQEFKIYGLELPYECGEKAVSIPQGIRIRYQVKKSESFSRVFVYFTEHCGMYYPEEADLNESLLMAWVKKKLVHAIMHKPAPTDWFNVLLWKEYRGIKNYFDEHSR